MMAELRSLVVLWLTGCGWMDAPGTPTRGAWKAGVGHWPANSASAVQGSLDQGYAAIEVDLFLTSDRVPVLSDSPALDPDRCRHLDGTAIDEPLFLVQLSWADLAANYRCGGQADPDHPDALVVDEALLDLATFIEILEQDPALEVHLDARSEPGFSHDPEVYAAEILERWWASGVPNPLRVSTNHPATLIALEERSETADRLVDTVLIWPRTAAGIEPASVGWLHELGATTGITDPLAAALDAGADGLRLSAALADRGTVLDARDQGLLVEIEGIERSAEADAFDRWPIDTSFLSAPEPAP